MCKSYLPAQLCAKGPSPWWGRGWRLGANQEVLGKVVNHWLVNPHLPAEKETSSDTQKGGKFTKMRNAAQPGHSIQS